MHLIPKLIISLPLLFSISYADLLIAFDTQSLNSTSKEPSKKQLVDINKIKEAAQMYNLQVTFKALPWKRSLLILEKGLIDGVINASYKADRANYAMYPMKNGQVDEHKRLNNGNSYFIYRHVNSPLRWNGKKFLNNGTVAAMEKYAVIDDLKKHSNIKIKTFTQNTDIVRQLSRGKFDAYAGEGRITDQILKKFPALAKNIIRDSLPIRKKPYFLIFSKKTYDEKKKEMEAIWSGLKELNKQ